MTAARSFEFNRATRARLWVLVALPALSPMAPVRAQSAPPGLRVTPVSPIPLVPQLNAVATGVDRLALAVGERGVIVRSVDDGVSWWRAPTPVTTSLRGVATTASVALAVGDGGVVLRSENAGAAWSAVPSGTRERLRAVALAGASNVALAVGDGGTMLRSVDRGRSWAALDRATEETLRAVTFSDASTVIAAGDGGTLLRSTDAGRTWTSVTAPTNAALRGVTFLDAKRGIAVGGDDARWRDVQATLVTSDGGVTWRATRAGTGKRLYGVAGKGNDVIAVGEGEMLRSGDAGATWKHDTTAKNPQEWLSSIAVSPTGAAVVSGFNMAAFIARLPSVHDTGSAWKPSRRVTKGVNGVIATIAAPDSSALVIAAGPNLMRSDDGGASFKPVKSDSAGITIHLEFLDARHGLAVGVRGSVLRTSDAGKTWVRALPVTRRNLRDAVYVDSATIVAVGALGGDGPALVRSVDGGRTWTGLTVPVGAMFGVAFRGRALGFAVGGAGSILRSADGGTTWTRVGKGLTTTVLRSVKVLDDRTVVIAGDDGIMLRSQDGGTTWTRVASGTREHLWTMGFADSRYGVASGVNGAFVVTEDGGQHWLRIELGTSTQLVAAYAWRGSMWLGGPNGVLLRVDRDPAKSLLSSRGMP